MKKLALAAVISVAATASFAGGKNQVILEPEVLVADTASSSNGGILVPLLALVLLAAAAS